MALFKPNLFDCSLHLKWSCSWSFFINIHINRQGWQCVKGQFCIQARLCGPVLYKTLLLSFSPCTEKSRACNYWLGAPHTWPIVRAMMDVYCVPAEEASPLTGMVCCIFIMYYYSLHCNLAQSKVCSLISIVISYFHSLTALRNEANSFMRALKDPFVVLWLFTWLPLTQWM